jgi:hypothetical protein
MGGSQSRSGRGGEEKNSQPLPGLEPPIVQLEAKRYTTDLSHLGQKTSKEETTSRDLRMDGRFILKPILNK